MKQLSYLLIAFVYLIFGEVTAQEKLGAITDNFLPVKQLGINPALMVDQRHFLSVNVTGAHIFARSNVINYPNSILLPKVDLQNEIYEEPNKFARGFIVGEVSGPSATLSYGKNAFGIHTGIRFYANMNRMPAILIELINAETTENVNDGDYSIKNGRFKSMSWGEVGLSYGRVLLHRDYDMISAGITVNRLIGIQQSSFNIKSGVVDVEDLSGAILDLDGKYSYTDLKFGSGGGWGMDLGITFKSMTDVVNKYLSHSQRGGCKVIDYNYRVGLSLLDVGYIRFKEGARYAKLKETDTITPMDLYTGDESVLGKDGDAYTAILPTALSLQLDFRIIDYIYVAGIVNQRLSFKNSFGAERSNLVGIAPRFETDWITASIPVSLSNYVAPQVGFYLRLGFLSVGTDHILPFVRRGDIRAIDLYFNINFFLKNSPECKVVDRRGIPWLCPAWR
jgi:hypothetical protein